MMKQYRIILIALLLSLSAPAEYARDGDTQLKLARLSLARGGNRSDGYVALSQAWSQKARETRSLDEYRKSYEAAREALELAPEDREVRLQLARASNALHRFDEGLELAKKVIVVEPDHAAAWAIAGDAYLETGRLEQARKCYEKMSRDHEPTLEDHARWARYWQKAGQEERMLESLLDAVAWADAHEQAAAEHRAWAHVMLGAWYFDYRHDLERAEESYRRAEAIMPRFTLLYEHLGELYAAKGQAKKSQSYYRKASELSGRNYPEGGGTHHHGSGAHTH